MTENVVPLRPDAEPATPHVPTLGLMSGIAEMSEILRDGERLPEGREGLGRELLLVRRAIAALRLYDERLSNAFIADVGKDRSPVVDGLPPIEIKSGANRSEWDRRGLLHELRHVARRQNVDMSTGEKQMSDDEALMHVIDAAARLEWRVTVLRGYGIDADAYCTKTPGRKSVVFLE